MSNKEAGKGDSPRKQQDQKAYEEGWDRIFRKREKEEPVKEDEDECND